MEYIDPVSQAVIPPSEIARISANYNEEIQTLTNNIMDNPLSICDAQIVTEKSGAQTSDVKCDQIIENVQGAIEDVDNEAITNASKEPILEIKESKGSILKTNESKESISETNIHRNKVRVSHKKANSLKSKHERANYQQKSSSTSFELDEIKKFETKVKQASFYWTILTGFKATTTRPFSSTKI